MKKSLLAAIAALSLAGFASNAMAGTITFNYLFDNTGSSLNLKKTADSFSGYDSNTTPLQINANTNGWGTVYKSNTTILSGSLNYQDPNRQYAGCIFTAVSVYNSYTKKYSMSVSSTVQGNTGAPVPTCSITWDGNNSTGNFYLYPKIILP